MTVQRIKEIQETTAYPNSVSVYQALMQVWQECEGGNIEKRYSQEELEAAYDKGLEDGFACMPSNII